MNNDESLLCVSNTHAQADEAVAALIRAGIDVKSLSLIGKGYHREEHPIGFYTSGDRIKAWAGTGAGTGAFWGGVLGLLNAPAIFVLPGLGLITMAGPIVAALFGALEGAVLLGGASALGAALTRIGVPEKTVIRYEMALNADHYVLIMHGEAREVAKARSVLEKAEAGAHGQGIAAERPAMHRLALARAAS
jgi:hypothetical protein